LLFPEVSAQIWNRSDALEEQAPPVDISRPSQLKIVQLNLPRYQGH